jgi:hypothetical protein
MNIDTAFPSKWLKASDLGENAPVVTISHVAMEQVGREQDAHPVVYFVGKNKGVVLNKTNAKAIAAIVGSAETDDWAGHKVQLFSMLVEFQGEQMQAIRVKTPRTAAPRVAKPAAKPTPAPEPDYDSAGSEAFDDDAVPF